MNKTMNAARAGAGWGCLLAMTLIAGPALADDCTVKIGATGPMTGGASAWGLALKAGVDFQAAMTNEAGGLQMGNRKCKVVVVSYDALYTASGGAAAANYFASENVHGIIGPIGSPETAGAKPVAKRNNQVLFSSSYYKEVLGPEFPLTFHLMQGPVVWGPYLIKEAKARFNVKTAVFLAPNDQGGTDAGKQDTKMYAEQGIALTPEYYQRGTTNFGPIATRIMNAKPDLVEVGSMPTADVTLAVKQLLEAGYTGVFNGLGGIGLNPVLQGAGGTIEKLKGYIWLELMPVDSPAAQKLREDFARVMKHPPPENALLYTTATATEQLLRAISLAGTDADGEKIAAALRKLTPESHYFGKGGWRGRTQYGINQELAFPVGMGIIAAGKNLGVKTVEIPSE